MWEKYIIVLCLVALFAYYYKCYNINITEPFSLIDEFYDTVDISVINLKSRPIKKKYMEDQFDKQDIKCNFFEAIDGNKLDLSTLTEKGVIDPKTSVQYFNRVLRKGEIGCSMSHVSIWMKLFPW